MSNDLPNNNPASKGNGLITPDRDYYPQFSPYNDFGRPKEYINIYSNFISPKIQESNVFNYDLPDLDIKELNDKLPKKKENIENLIKKNKEDEKKEEKLENNVINDKIEEIECIPIKEQNIDFHKLIKLSYEDKSNLSCNKLNTNNSNKNLNYKPKFIVIKNFRNKIKTKLGKKKRGRKKGKRGYNRLTKNTDKNNINSIKINKTNLRGRKKEKIGFIQNFGFDNNFDIKALFQNENIINSQKINRNFNFINNSNSNNNINNNNMSHNINNNINNLNNNIFNNNSIKYFQNQKIQPIKNNLIKPKIIYKEESPKLLQKSNSAFRNINDSKIKEKDNNLSNIIINPNKNNLNNARPIKPSAVKFMPQIFESKTSSTVIDGIEYATLLVPKNYVEKIKKIIVDE